MKYFIKAFLLVFIIFCKNYVAQAQDVNYSQFHHAPMVTNPAAIATKDQMQFAFNYRNQWRGIGQNFTTPMLSFIYPLIKKDEEGYLKKRWGGIGASFINDRVGEGGLLQTTGAMLAFAYNFSLPKSSYLSVGAEGGFFQRRIDVGALISGSQLNGGVVDPNIPFDENIDNSTVTYPLFNTGVMWYKESDRKETKSYLGASFYNINRPNTSFINDLNAPLSFRYIFTGGIRALRSEKFSITPNFRWIEQSNTSQVNIGSLFKYHFSENAGSLFRSGTVGFGTWYSVNNALILSFEVDTPNYTLGFSYDFNTSQLADAPGAAGATEIVFAIKRTLGRKRDEKPPINDVEPPTIDDEIDSIIRIPADTVETPSDTLDLNKNPNPDTTIAKNNPKTTNQDVEKYRVAFNFDSYALSPKTRVAIDSVIDIMKADPTLMIEVRGHTCNIGSLESNQAISERRAEMVKAYMVQKGIAPERIITKGYNYSLPIAPNTTPEGRRRNRRTDFKVADKK